MSQLTIFSLPKPMDDSHVRMIQRNAIASWASVHDARAVIMGNDTGLPEAAHEFGCDHVADVAVSEFGTPMLDSAFAIAQERYNSPYLVYINGDIVLPENFTDILSSLPNGPFLAVGQRTDLDVQSPAESSSERRKLFERAKTEGELHTKQGIDYFLFRRGQFPPIASFAVGRSAFDNWLLRTAKVNGLKLIDLTEVVTVLHENHPPAPQNAGELRKGGSEARRNIAHMRRKTWYYTIADANWRLTPNGLRYNWLHYYPYWRRVVRALLRP